MVKILRIDIQNQAWRDPSNSPRPSHEGPQRDQRFHGLFWFREHVADAFNSRLLGRRREKASEYRHRPLHFEVDEHWKVCCLSCTPRSANLMDHVFNVMEQYAANLEQEVEERTKELLDEKKKSDILLYRMLPKYACSSFREEFQNGCGQVKVRPIC